MRASGLRSLCHKVTGQHQQYQRHYDRHVAMVQWMAVRASIERAPSSAWRPKRMPQGKAVGEIHRWHQYAMGRAENQRMQHRVGCVLTQPPSAICSATSISAVPASARVVTCNTDLAFDERRCSARCCTEPGAFVAQQSRVECSRLPGEDGKQRQRQQQIVVTMCWKQLHGYRQRAEAPCTSTISSASKARPGRPPSARRCQLMTSNTTISTPTPSPGCDESSRSRPWSCRPGRRVPATSAASAISLCAASGLALAKQPGQSGQPRPEPVRRVKAPNTTRSEGQKNAVALASSCKPPLSPRSAHTRANGMAPINSPCSSSVAEISALHQPIFRGRQQFAQITLDAIRIGIGWKAHHQVPDADRACR